MQKEKEIVEIKTEVHILVYGVFDLLYVLYSHSSPMSSSPFESTRHVNELDQEYWLARELSVQLGYKSYPNFVNVIEKARAACEQSSQRPEDHIQGFEDYIQKKNGVLKKTWNIRLSRYACYLVTQNADSRKPMVAMWQSYFAMQTRMQELQAQHIEDQKRVMLRDEIKKHNIDLAKTARRAWVSNYGDFVDYGYKGLYWGLTNRDLHKKKWLEKDERILDHSNSEELAANLFRATQTESMIRREWIRGQHSASMAHYRVWEKVRSTIQEIWGTMPEELPAVEHVKEAEKRIEAYETGKSSMKNLVNTYWETQWAEPVSQESTSWPLIFPFPNDIQLLSDVAQIILKNPGSIDIVLGHEEYRINTTGLEMVKERLYGG